MDEHKFAGSDLHIKGMHRSIWSHCKSFKNGLFIFQDGDRFWRMPECYIRGSTIKYLRIPDEVIDMVKEDAQMKARNRQEMKGGRNQQNQRQGLGRNQQGGNQNRGNFQQNRGNQGNRGGGAGGGGGGNFQHKKPQQTK